MGVDMSDPRLRLPKGEKRATTKRRKDRGEALIKKLVRAACVVRDGRCRLHQFQFAITDVIVGHEDAPMTALDCNHSQWAHFDKHKRARTRGMKAEERHTTAGSLMLCKRAHDAYDAGTLQITALTRTGCDGRLKFRWSKS